MRFSSTQLAFSAALLLVVVVRSYVAINDPLWIDELHTVWVTNGDFSEVANRARLGNQQPLYFQLVWIVRSSLQWAVSDNATAFTVRLVSLVAGWVLVLGASYLAFLWSGCKQAAICTAWVMVLNQDFLFYGTEARPYGLMSLAAIVQVYFFWQWLRLVGLIQGDEVEHADRTRLVITYLGLVLATVIAIRIHLTALWLMMTELLFVFFALLLVLLNYERKRKLIDLKLTLVSSLAVLVGIILLSATLLPDVFRLIERKENWSVISDSSAIWRELRWVLLGFGVIGLITLHFNILSMLVDEKSSQSWVSKYERIWQVKFVFLWATVPFIIVLLFEYTGLAPLAVTRYALVGAVAVPIGIGLLVSLIASRFLRSLMIIILVIVLGAFELWSSSLLFRQKLQLRFEDWSSVVEEVKQNPNGYPVLLLANLLEDGAAFDELAPEQLEYLKFPLQAFPVIDDPRISIIPSPTLNFQSLPDRIVQSIQQTGGSWLIIRSTIEMREEIVDEIFIQLTDDGTHEASVQQAGFPSSEWSDVHLFQFNLKSIGAQ